MELQRRSVTSFGSVELHVATNRTTGHDNEVSISSESAASTPQRRHSFILSPYSGASDPPSQRTDPVTLPSYSDPPPDYQPPQYDDIPSYAPPSYDDVMTNT